MTSALLTPCAHSAKRKTPGPESEADAEADVFQSKRARISRNENPGHVVASTPGAGPAFSHETPRDQLSIPQQVCVMRTYTGRPLI